MDNDFQLHLYLDVYDNRGHKFCDWEISSMEEYHDTIRSLNRNGRVVKGLIIEVSTIDNKVLCRKYIK